MGVAAARRRRSVPVTPIRTGVVYGRQSKTRELSESLDTQTKACQATADQFGIEVRHVILEPPSTSAYTERGRLRPRFPEVLELLRSGEVDTVIAYKTDRLSRGGGPGWAPLFEAAEEAGLDLDRFVLIPGSGFMSEFELGIRATMDREESKKTEARLRDMKARHAAQGRPSGRNNHRPFGYEYDRVTVQEEEAALVRQATDRFLSGEGLLSIVRSWNRAGHRTPTGKLWSDATLRNILLAPRIAGLRQHRGEVVGEALWPALIDRAAWEQVRARFRASAGRPGPNAPRSILLRGLGTCGLCGCKLEPVPVGERLRLRCTKRPGRPQCGGITIAMQPVEDFVVAQVIYRLSSPALDERRRPGLPAPSRDLARELSAVDSKLKELAQDWAAERITRSEWLEAREALAARREAAEAELARDLQEKAVADLARDPAPVDVLWPDLPFTRQRAILQAVIAEVRIKPASRRGSKTVDLDRVEVLWRV